MRKKIYLFGDSITEMSFAEGGWGASLTNHFARTVDVVLRGYSGYNTRWALKVIDKVFPVQESGVDPPLAVTVFFGANDASLPDRSCGFQHVPLHEYQNNLKSIVSSLQKRWPTTHVVLITPPPIDEKGRLLYPFLGDGSGLPERTNESAGTYAKACLAVASECQIPVIDLWNKMQNVPGWQKACLSDGLHLTPDGNKIVFDEVLEKLKEKGLSLETLPHDLPLILSDIDPKDPHKAFEN